MTYVLTVKRLKSDVIQTTGEFQLHVNGALQLTGFTLELPWRDNERQVSCIPPGKYRLKHFHSPKFGRCLELQQVPGRDAILIHAGNYNRDTHGCILIGANLIDLNKDGNLDVTSSKVTMLRLMNSIGGETDGFINIS